MHGTPDERLGECTTHVMAPALAVLHWQVEKGFGASEGKSLGICGGWVEAGMHNSRFHCQMDKTIYILRCRYQVPWIVLMRFISLRIRLCLFPLHGHGCPSLCIALAFVTSGPADNGACCIALVGERAREKSWFGTTRTPEPTIWRWILLGWN
jgi:hypothetical protein